jgi:hypothetical protein
MRADGSLAWVRDDANGGYPLHVAAWYGRAQVVECILEVAGKYAVLQW